MRKYVVFIFLFSSLCTHAQTGYNTNEPRRILILLDGSGSMLEEWKGSTKWAIAKKLIAQTLDSIERNDPEVAIGLRLFGHQTPRALKDCKDSKLEVLIAKNSSAAIKNKLEEIVPKGNTPIAYSLFLAAGDFPEGEGVNSIILITDGIENCEGNPCANSEVLRNKRITLKPFIIGVGLNESDKNKFDCVGSYYDATDETTFKNAMNIVISQALNNTTAQINLIDAYGLPSETNVELTLYDAYSGEVRYNFVHSLNAKNEPDTLYLNPLGKYDIVVHTTPPVEKKQVELNPGKHNIIGIDAPQGTLFLNVKGNEGSFSDKQCVIRNPATNEIIYLQNLNTKQKYITGKYDLEIITLPKIIYRNYEIKSGIINQIDIAQPGTLNISTSDNIIFSLFEIKDNVMEKIYDGFLNKTALSLDVQPGDYKIVYRSNIKKLSVNTHEADVNIKSGKLNVVKLDSIK